jgi:hypothetical protein
VVERQVQQPIIDFTGPWDDFMVHGVNDNFGYTKEQKCQSDHGVQGVKRHILRPTSSNDIIQHVLRWERQKRYFGRRKGKGL